MSGLPTTVAGLADALAAGEVSSREIVDHLFARADKVDSAIASYTERFDDAARAAARRCDDERARGEVASALHGVPITVKDLVATVEGPTLGQTRVRLGVPEGVDAPSVVALRRAGAIVLGKASLNELACGIPSDDPLPRARNPWDTQRWPGGSSSGSGGAVAADLVPASLGSDCGGSIRIPASLCGVSGFKPTFNTIAAGGVVPLSYTSDTLGPLAHTARDCRLFIEAVLAHGGGARPLAPHDPPYGAVVAASLQGVRVGVDRRAFDAEGVDPALADRFEAALAVLRDAGAQLRPVEFSTAPIAAAALRIVTAVDAFEAHKVALREQWSSFGPTTRLALCHGGFYSGSDYVHAQRVRAGAGHAVLEAMRDVDVVVGPTLGMAAPRFDVDFFSLMPLFSTHLWNALGAPALSVPMGGNADGLPLGLQFAAAPGRDAVVLAAGEAFQQLTGWHDERPQV